MKLLHHFYSTIGVRPSLAYNVEMRGLGHMDVREMLKLKIEHKDFGSVSIGNYINRLSRKRCCDEK